VYNRHGQSAARGPYATLKHILRPLDKVVTWENKLFRPLSIKKDLSFCFSEIVINFEKCVHTQWGKNVSLMHFIPFVNFKNLTNCLKL